MDSSEEPANINPGLRASHSVTEHFKYTWKALKINPTVSFLSQRSAKVCTKLVAGQKQMAQICRG